MWWNKQRTEQEDSKIWEHIKDMQTKLAKLSSEVEGLDQKIKSLRGFINKKVGLEDPAPSTENDLNDDGFGFLRK